MILWLALGHLGYACRVLRVLLDENNDLPPGGPVLGGGIESATTALQAVFGTQAGEWPYALRFGMPWRNAVLVKYFDANTTRALTASRANTVTDIVPVTPGQVTVDEAATQELIDARQILIYLNGVALVGDTSGQVFDINVTTEL